MTLHVSLASHLFTSIASSRELWAKPCWISFSELGLNEPHERSTSTNLRLSSKSPWIMGTKIRRRSLRRSKGNLGPQRRDGECQARRCGFWKGSRRESRCSRKLARTAKKGIPRSGKNLVWIALHRFQNREQQQSAIYKIFSLFQGVTTDRMG